VLLRLAWRNIWRNRRRTIISLLALAMGVMAIISIHSFRISANEVIVEAVTRGLVGDVQVHARGYQDEPELDKVVPAPAVVDAMLAAFVPSARTERRVIGGGLASASDAATSALVLGIEPEKPDARALVKIERGRWLAPRAAGEAARAAARGDDRPPAREAVIGKTLANELGVTVGGEVVLVSQAADGSLANERYTVVGLGDVGNEDANATSVFLHIQDAQELFALGTGVHQIIVRGSDDATRMRALLDPSLEVVSWTQIIPDLKSSMDSKERNSRLLDLIVFLIVALGILNTMTMATFERTRELGVLAALGTRRRRILAMILIESLMLGVLGFAIGLALAFALLTGLGTTSMGGFGNAEFMGVRMPETIDMTIQSGPVIKSAIISALTMLAGGLIPAIRAARQNPIDAMRHV